MSRENEDHVLSREAALIALAQACDQLGKPTQLLVQMNKSAPDLQQNAEAPQSEPPPLSITSRSHLSQHRFQAGTLVGLTGLLAIGAVAFAWHSLRDQAAMAPISASMETLAKPTPPKHMAATTDAERTRPPAQAPAGTAPASPTTAGSDTAQSIQKIARELEDIEREINQLRAGRTQAALDKAELAERLKQMQEAARQETERQESLASAQTQLARDNASLAEQLSSSQAQMTNVATQVKASQEQMADITGQLKSIREQISRSSEQKSRPRPVPIAALPSVNSTRKLTTPSLPQQVRSQTREPRQPPH
jgi:hypothetical protein